VAEVPGAEGPEPTAAGTASTEEEGPHGRWGRLYALVLGVLALEIAGLWVLARAFR
jgi:hypothetical protein